MINRLGFILSLLSLSSWANDKLPDIPLALSPISEHCFYVEGGIGMASDNAGFISNAGVIITDKQLILIDALGTPALAQKLLQQLRQKTDKPISHVIVTHYHAEHVYGLQIFKAAGAKIIAAHGVRNYIDSPQAQARLQERRFSLAPWVNDATRLIPPDQFIDEPTHLKIDNIDLLLTPEGSNHSEADLSILVENDHVLFAGDLIFSERLPFIAQGNLEHWLNYLNQLNIKQLKAIVPGHGKIQAQPSNSLEFTRNYLHYLQTSMNKAVRQFINFDTAYQQTNWQDFIHLPTFDAANRRNAYQVYLELEAKAIE